MKARKCDVCGEFFLPYMFDINDRKSEYYRIAVKVEKIDCGGKEIDGYDLCEKCHKTFKEWIRSNEEN